ncbi:MAG: glycoside hydrolase family 13 [Candidatus Latescibacteria bacterium]|nr:glycoside hydrolase family 13 [Candidatus Latescibacterota bacterium]NIM22415.1 glycoside hydrolase family 13 [Candidatus Latescibacterota bacterium]NIM64775.1 glycoside hydrolase family 13 [Candidatus Latescibacterota bacterium]NIO01286.1 glycoside hydrolase family 13 [Candidatus Latescibacterota bacterium]NIO27778.1 glycoside hydrolase family 13 [Candidatus Latescibacterota bacterium]
MSGKSLKYADPQRTSPKKAKGARSENDTVFVCGLKPTAKEVYLVGDFNDWDPQSDRMVKKKGVFQKTKRLAPGEYQYKFLVDGEWHSDPSAPRQVPNEFGTTNSVIRIEAGSKK